MVRATEFSSLLLIQPLFPFFLRGVLDSEKLRDPFDTELSVTS